MTKLTKKAIYDSSLFEDINLLLRQLDKPAFVDWAETVAKFQKYGGSIVLALVHRTNLPADVLGLVNRLSLYNKTAE